MFCLAAMLDLTIRCCFFFGLTGKFGLIYILKYIKSETDNEFVNPQNVSTINIHGYNGYVQIKNSLKYCNNITSFAIDIASSGHFFENFVVGELMRNYCYGDTKVNLTYYRDSNQKEIDIIIEENGILHPVEIKKGTSPDKSAVKSFGVLRTSGCRVGTGLVFCMTDRVFPVDSENILVPVNII